ncbi:MAG: cytochrome P450 [Myxococcales bacterium]|nr:cytochrome P450 [Myxococcales bacterium]
MLPLPPGRRGLPIVGETLDFLRSPQAFTDERFAEFGDTFHANILGKPTLFMLGADANHWIFSGEGKYLQNEWSPAIQRLLGERSLSLLVGEEHKQRRQILGPHFKRTAMAGAIPAILTVARKHLRRWQTDAELGPIAVVPRMRSLAFEVAATYLLGEIGDLGVDLDEFSRDFETWTKGMFVVVAKPLPFTRFGQAMAARRRMFTVIDDLVMRRDAASHRGVDVLSTLLEVRDEQGELLDRDAIVDELQLLLFAGHDTTVTATSNAIYHLALHPELARRARDEQAAMDTQDFSLESLRAMSFLDALIKESMRLIPPIGGAFRVMLRDEQYRGFRIPQGWRVAVGPRGVHRDPAYFPEPERFDPDRWLDPAQEQSRPPFSYVPFGGGPRTCLGMHFALLEMQIVLSMLLRDFEWELAADQDLSFTAIPLPLPRSGTIVHLRRRASR